MFCSTLLIIREMQIKTTTKYCLTLVRLATIKKSIGEVAIVAQWKRIRTVSMRMWVRSLALLSGLGIWRCCELWCSSQTRLGSCIAVLWRRPAATAPIIPLAWEPPYAMGPALKKKTKDQKKKKIQMLWLNQVDT